jgi:hypothetical protein
MGTKSGSRLVISLGMLLLLDFFGLLRQLQRLTHSRLLLQRPTHSHLRETLESG